ncbi:MAG: type III-A CRISPR-associated protein Csm2, partial [Anaerolineae bacterium]|nr:type III-A CRISPR-associated protein Csm2 [Anaerolineae bacterium]
MSNRPRSSNRNRPGNPIQSEDLTTIITSAEGTQLLVDSAESFGRQLKNERLTTSQIRALFGEVRRIQARWQGGDAQQQLAKRDLILMKPKLAYRAARERGAVQTLKSVLDTAIDLVVSAPPRGGQPLGSSNTLEDNFQRFADFFEAVLAYHKAAG